MTEIISELEIEDKENCNIDFNNITDHSAITLNYVPGVIQQKKGSKKKKQEAFLEEPAIIRPDTTTMNT